LCQFFSFLLIVTARNLTIQIVSDVTGITGTRVAMALGLFFRGELKAIGSCTMRAGCPNFAASSATGGSSLCHCGEQND
jgi:hypothetical protein